HGLALPERPLCESGGPGAAVGGHCGTWLLAVVDGEEPQYRAPGLYRRRRRFEPGSVVRAAADRHRRGALDPGHGIDAVESRAARPLRSDARLRVDPRRARRWPDP